MKYSTFMMPLHPPGRSVTDTLQEDRQAVILADRLGFSEAFVGEHVTDSAEPVTSSLLFLATLAILVAYLEFSNSRALLVMLVLPVVLQLWVVHTENLASAQLGLLGFSLLTVGAAASVDVGEDALILQFAAISLAANAYLSLAVPALYAANQSLREQVSHDGLTGALSRANWVMTASAPATSGMSVSTVLHWPPMSSNP